MLRTLLVDDEAPARSRLRRLRADHPDVVCVGEAADGVDALGKIRELEPDLILLDIQMPELDGLSVASALAEPGPRVVFVTAYDAHALRAFELAAVDYLLKPVSKERLAAALARVRCAARSPAQEARAVNSGIAAKSRRMAVRTGSKYVVFDVEHIAAILSQDHYAAIWVDGKELLSDEPLDRLMLRLDGTQFLRVHRGAILNLNYLSELLQEGDRKYVARVAGCPSLCVPISRDRLEELRKRLGLM